jgi:Holliday junction resolvasome RuvABC DNA-binding subunit
VLIIILGFYRQQPADRLANDPGLNYKTARRFVLRLQKTTSHVSELEASRLKREIESGEAYSSKNWVV